MGDPVKILSYQLIPWKVAAFLDKCSGYCPYNHWLKRGLLVTYHSFIFISIALALMNGLVKNYYLDYLLVVRSSMGLLFVAADWSKLLGLAGRQNMRRRVYDKIFSHFRDATEEDEAKTLNEFAKHALKFFIVYMCSLMITGCVFSAIPGTRSFINYYFSDNEKLHMQLPIDLDYGVDENQHLIAIHVHYSLFVISTLISVGSFDLSYILQIRHVCALLKIVMIRLEKASEILIECQNGNNTESTEVDAQKLIKRAIEVHGEAFELLSLIEEEHSICFFFLLWINAACFAGLIHLISHSVSNLVELSRHSIIMIALLLHFYFIFSQGQLITDTSKEVLDVCYNCRWYCLPKKMRTAWKIIMIRNSMPCQITGGKCFVLNFETYSKMLKIGMSYYTIFEN